MKYLVTGGAGFIGSHLVCRLLQQGDNVVVVDNFNDLYDPKYKEENLAATKNNPRFVLCRFDVNEKNKLVDIIKGHKIEIIVHLAAYPGVRLSFLDPKKCRHANVHGSQAVFEADLECSKIPIVYASSSTVYGNDENVPFVENLEFGAETLSPYGETKRKTEKIAESFKKYGIDSMGLRFFSIFGERQRPDLAIYIFTKALFEGKLLPVLGDGSNKRDLTYISDAVNGILAAVSKVKGIGHEVVNIGNTNPVVLMDIIKELECLVGKKGEIEYKEKHPGDSKINCADLTKAHKLLGYVPTVHWQEGMKRFVEWYKAYRLAK